MVQEIFQLEDNEVLITDGQNTYADSKDNFYKDYPKLPLNNETIIYNKTLKVHVIDGKMQEFELQPDFDTCIDSLQSIIDAQLKRTAPPEPPVSNTESNQLEDTGVN